MTENQFGQLVEQYEKLVYTICYQFTRNHHTAQDLTQETFLAAYRHINSCPADNEKPWLARIASNKAKDHLKSAYNRRVYTAEGNPLPEGNTVLFASAEQPEDIAISKEQVQRIAASIQALHEPYHQVATLYFLEEKSVEEISRLLNRPQKTVHTQLYRAKNILKKEWKEDKADVVS